MSTGRKVIFAGATDVLARVGAIVLFAALARSVGTEGFGAYAQANTVVAFVAPFAALGLTAAMVRHFAGQAWDSAARSRFAGVLAFVTALTVPVAVVFWAAASELDHAFLQVPIGTELFRWTAPLVVLTALELVLFDLLRARQWIGQLAVTQLVSNLGSVAGGTAALFVGGDVVDVIRAALLVKVVVVCATIAIVWAGRGHAASTRDDTPFRLTLVKMVSFGLPVAMSGLGLWMMNFADRLVIGHFLSAAELGVYSAAYVLALLVAGVQRPLNLPLYPRLVAAASAGSTADAAREIRVFQRLGTLVLVPASVLLVAAAPRLLATLGGDAFAPPLVVVAMLVTAVALDQWNAAAQYIVLSRDQAVFTQNVWLVAGAANVLANIAIVPAAGLVGAAGVTLATFAVLETVFFLRASQSEPLLRVYQWGVAARALAASALAALAASLYWSGAAQGAVPFVAGAALFGSVYLAAMLLLRGIAREDVRLVGEALGLRPSRS